MNTLDNDLGRLAINLATNTVCSTKDFFDSTLQILGKGLVAHGPSDLDDLVESDRLVVLDILLLLAITRGLFESLNDERRSGRNNRDRSLAILDGELDSYAQAFL